MGSTTGNKFAAIARGTIVAAALLLTLSLAPAADAAQLEGPPHNPGGYVSVCNATFAPSSWTVGQTVTATGYCQLGYDEDPSAINLGMGNQVFPKATTTARSGPKRVFVQITLVASWAQNSGTDAGSCGVNMPSSVGQPCRFDGVHAYYPVDYWSGGSPGGAGPSANPAGTCEVVAKSAGNGVWVATLRSLLTNPEAGTTDAIVVDWGDGSTDTTTASGEDETHNYSGAGPWTTTSTATRTMTSNGVTTTAQCITTIDFNTSALPSSEYDGDELDPVEPPGGAEENCSTFDIPCWLRKLFVPDPELVEDRWDSLQDALASTWPFGPLGWAATEVTTFVAAIDDAREWESGTQPIDDTFGLDITSVVTCPGEDHIGVFNISTAGWYPDDIRGEPANGAPQTFPWGTCEGATFRGLLRDIAKAGIVIWGVLMIYRKASNLISNSNGEEA